ncbi:MAG: TetR/AcrR family transcriptional regulator [Rhodoblastus sp.]|nr:MAG: TetR/AcrR family transcriptional regulator [Rhodoblastus sp.]
MDTTTDAKPTLSAPAPLTNPAPLATSAPATVAEEPVDSAKRRQILEGARAVFLAHGFDGASMNDVARGAGVSKGTLYVYFPSKEALFEALVREGKARQGERFAKLSTEQEPAQTLRGFGVTLLDVMSAPASIAQLRTIIGVTAKFPQIGRAFYEAGPAHGAEKLAGYLAAETARGRLAVADPGAAATQFLDLCKSGLLSRLLFGVVETLTREEIEANVARAVEVFLAAYGVRTDSRSGAA